MRPKVSIIIPVYKVEKYLQRCLDSVLRQTLKEIEVVLIDDGSPDNCGKICDEYAQRDTRIKVIHKENAGVSSARNRGLKIATGEYVGFVDSDDFIAPTMFEVMYRQAILADADICMCEFIVTDGDKSGLLAKTANDNPEIIYFNAKEAFVAIADFSKNIQVAVWNKIYRRELVDGIEFDIHKVMSEDMEYLMRAVVKSQVVVYIPEALYGYFAQREGAATFHANHDIQWYLMQNNYITGIMKEIATIRDEFKNLAAGYKCVNGNLSIANAIVRMEKPDADATKIVRKELKENIKDVMKSELHIIKKIQMLVFIASPKLYIKIMKKKLVD